MDVNKAGEFDFLYSVLYVQYQSRKGACYEKFHTGGKHRKLVIKPSRMFIPSTGSDAHNQFTYKRPILTYWARRSLDVGFNSQIEWPSLLSTSVPVYRLPLLSTFDHDFPWLTGAKAIMNLLLHIKSQTRTKPRRIFILQGI